MSFVLRQNAAVRRGHSEAVSSGGAQREGPSGVPAAAAGRRGSRHARGETALIDGVVRYILFHYRYPLFMYSHIVMIEIR